MRETLNFSMTDFPLSEIVRRCPNSGQCDPLTCFWCDLERKERDKRRKEAEVHKATLERQRWVEQVREYYDE